MQQDLAELDLPEQDAPRLPGLGGVRDIRGRIGVWRAGTYDPTAVPEVTPILDGAVQALQDAGATIVDPADINITGDEFNAEFAALLCEFKTDIGSYLQTHTAAGYPKTLQDLIDFNAANAKRNREGPWNSLIFDLAQQTNGRDADCATQRAAATPPATHSRMAEKTALHSP